MTPINSAWKATVTRKFSVKQPMQIASLFLEFIGAHLPRIYGKLARSKGHGDHPFVMSINTQDAGLKSRNVRAIMANTFPDICISQCWPYSPRHEIGNG